MNGKQMEYQEKTLHAPNGLAVLLINIVLMFATVAGIVYSAMQLAAHGGSAGMIALLAVCILYWCRRAGCCLRASRCCARTRRSC